MVEFEKTIFISLYIYLNRNGFTTKKKYFLQRLCNTILRNCSIIYYMAILELATDFLYTRDRYVCENRKNPF